jgi:cytochrome c biogenesis protein CcdA
MSEWEALPGILALAFGLGLLHALDADHILAVSSLASGQRDGARRARRLCLRWALGHGAILLLLGTLAWSIGARLPDGVSHYAEALVGLMLVGMGLWVLRDLRRRALRLDAHHHAGLPRHIHWRAGDGGHADHGATLVGALHGLAGSAPLLALIPLATQTSLLSGLLYLGLFSLGALLAMLLFGGLLGLVFTRLAHWGERGLVLLRGLIAGGSLGVGLLLLYRLSA